MTFDGYTSDHVTHAYRRGLKDAKEVTRKRIVWEFKDFEPKQDIQIQVTPNISRTETYELLKSFHKRIPNDPFVTEALGVYHKWYGDPADRQTLHEQLLVAWQDRIVMWGPAAEDKQLLRDSSKVWSLVRKMTIFKTTSSFPGCETTNPKKTAPVIEKIAKRVLEQANAADQQSRTVKLFQPQIEKVLAWCQPHLQE